MDFRMSEIKKIAYVPVDIVYAEEMDRFSFDKMMGLEIGENGRVNASGFVVTPNIGTGAFWVSTEDFEKLYRKFRDDKLARTIPFMYSDDYSERLRAEYSQLKIRTERLKELIEKWDYEVMIKPACPRSAFDIQLRAMQDYLDILKVRAETDHVNIDFV